MNWVDEVLDNAARTVRAWPEWMRRPEVRGVNQQRVAQSGGVEVAQSGECRPSVFSTGRDA